MASLMKKHEVLMGTKEMKCYDLEKATMGCSFPSTSRFDGRLNSVTRFCIMKKTCVNLVIDSTRGHG